MCHGNGCLLRLTWEPYHCDCLARCIDAGGEDKGAGFSFSHGYTQILMPAMQSTLPHSCNCQLVLVLRLLMLDCTPFA